MKVGLALANAPFDIGLVQVAVASALPILLLSKRKTEVLRKVDWHTLVFFAAMFVLMQAVWDTNFFQSAMATLDADVLATPFTLLASVLVSQAISNVPWVALYLPLMTYAGASTKDLMVLAAGSTIAGNLFIIGAASNVIIVQAAGKKFGETVTFVEFAKLGIPLAALNVLVYWIFFYAF